MRYVFAICLALISCRQVPPAPFSMSDGLGAGSPPGGPATYVMDPDSRLEVRTSSAGVLAGFGHGHRIRATEFSGTIVYDPADVEASSVRVSVKTAGLIVLKEGADLDDGAKVQQIMLTRVLNPDNHSTIEFVSNRISSPGPALLLQGDLTLGGATRPIEAQLVLGFEDGRLLGRCTFAILQSDFGIEPYSAAGGAIQVGDEVLFDLDIVATRVDERGSS